MFITTTVQRGVQFQIIKTVAALQGFASELIGEILTGGKGPLGQIGVPIGQPLNSEVGGFALAVRSNSPSLFLPLTLLYMLGSDSLATRNGVLS